MFSAGKSDLDSDQTFPIAQENVFGITFQGIRSENSSIGLETGYFYRYGSNDHVVVPGRGTFDYDHNVDEVFAGLWAPFDIGWGLHPYVGAGGEWLGIKAHEQGAFTSATDRDMGWGGYVHAGLMIDVVDHVQIGVDLRAEFTNHLGLFGEHAYGDFRQAAVVIGIGI